MNKGNKYFISGAVICSEYSNISFLHLIIGNTQKFILGDKNGRNDVSTASTNLLYFTITLKSNNQNE